MPVGNGPPALISRRAPPGRGGGPGDARRKNLGPTPRAAELDAEVRACLRQTEVLLTRGLSEGQVQLFKETLAAMIRNLDAAGAQNPGPD